MFTNKIRNFFTKDVLIWGVILLLALFLRLYGLDLNPVGITHDDELHEIINAKSLAITGTNIPGVVTGILTKNGHCIIGDCVYGELESYFLIPWMFIFPLGLFLSKIPFVIGSVVLVFATGKIFENLSKKSIIGMSVGLLVAINPWAIYFGRTAYPQYVSHLFYILGVYFFTRHTSYKSNLILGSLFSFSASLFYFGAKPILPLIIIWGISYNLLRFKIQNFKFTVLFILFLSVIIGGYFIILSNSYAGVRFKEVENVGLSLRFEKFIGFFSPHSLFLSGQRASDDAYISGFGFYYLIDLLFLFFGLIAIFKNFNNALFIILIVIISVLPSAFKTSEANLYSVRAGLAYPLISGIIGWGCYYFFNKISIVRRKYIFKSFLVMTTGLYLLFLAYFLILYWHKLPRIQAGHWFFHERLLTNYITRLQSKSDKKIIVLTTRPDGIFNSFVFYSGIYNSKDVVIKINSHYLSQNFEYNGAEFTSDCQKITKSDLDNSIILIDQINPIKCRLDQKNTPKIANPRDAGGIFNIINESLCSNYPKNRYPNPRSIYDFKVENLSNEAFCKMWITNPDQ